MCWATPQSAADIATLPCLISAERWLRSTGPSPFFEKPAGSRKPLEPSLWLEDGQWLRSTSTTAQQAMLRDQSGPIRSTSHFQLMGQLVNPSAPCRSSLKCNHLKMVTKSISSPSSDPPGERNSPEPSLPVGSHRHAPVVETVIAHVFGELVKAD